MENFEFQNKTKIIFGRGTENQVGEETAKHKKKILLHYGSKSIKASGLYEKVVTSLKNAGVEFLELGGVQPNPRLELVKKGIEICKNNSINFILAVGGGSVIDSAKAIAVGIPYEGDVWDFYSGIATPEKAIDVATILTIPAAGSESSGSSVITNSDGDLKRGITDDLLRPVFSILNPELTFTLPNYQTACGAVDILAHLFERYFTNTKNVDFSDRMLEATMKTIINNVPLSLSDPKNYDARAEVMWAGCVAHNDLLGMGREEDWASHGIEHELSGIYDVAHGAGLAVVFPAWMKYVYKKNPQKFIEFATRVWKIKASPGNMEATALAGILALEKFFRSIGMPTTLKELNIGTDRLEEMANKCTGNGKYKIGEFVKLDKNAVLEILKLAL